MAAYRHPGQRDRGHQQIKSGLVLVGGALSVCGLILTIAGLSSFLSSFNGDGRVVLPGPDVALSITPPDRFWMAFFGMPMLAIGLAMLRMGLLRETTRYVVDELNPVAQDAVNEFARGARPGIAEIASAIRAPAHEDKPAEERLRQLDDLKRRGLVNGDEYDRERRRILAEI